MQGDDWKYVLNFSLKSEQKWPLGRNGRRWMSSTGRDLKEIGHKLRTRRMRLRAGSSGMSVRVLTAVNIKIARRLVGRAGK